MAKLELCVSAGTASRTGPRPSVRVGVFVAVLTGLAAAVVPAAAVHSLDGPQVRIHPEPGRRDRGDRAGQFIVPVRRTRAAAVVRHVVDIATRDPVAEFGVLRSVAHALRKAGA